MSESVSYREIHAYMLQKTQQYYQNPPAILVEQTRAELARKGVEVSFAEARKMVSPILIQRLVKEEMAQKWPEFMSAIPSNPLRDEE